MSKFNFTLVPIPFLSLIFDSWLVNRKFQLGKKYVSYKSIIFYKKNCENSLSPFSGIKA